MSPDLSFVLFDLVNYIKVSYRKRVTGVDYEVIMEWKI